MQRTSPATLRAAIAAAGGLSSRLSVGPTSSATWGQLGSGSVFNCHAADLHGRSIVLAAIGKFAAAAAMIALDGVVRRMVLYPPDLSREHLSFVAQTAEAGVILIDEPLTAQLISGLPDSQILTLTPPTNTSHIPPPTPLLTEWILLTSGTTGRPKLVQHNLASLTGDIDFQRPPEHQTVWSTFYDIRRYGGLHIFLDAVTSGASLVLACTNEPLVDFLTRAGSQGLTHISGTPSHWRRALMSPWAGRISPQYIRLSGEIVDQAILNGLRAQYPLAQIGHTFASTEAGVAFSVNDELMGFPLEVLDHTPNVEMKVVDSTLRIRSQRMASRYLGPNAPALKNPDGFIDTGDSLAHRNGRYYLVGRRDGIVNVGGFKVHPEEVEAVLNRHPAVAMSLVRAKKNPITGALVVSDVVLNSTDTNSDPTTLQRDIIRFCHQHLEPHKVPAFLRFVPALAVADSGKMLRRAT
jgi:acyl-coenzyme A synthetase/AMP-(fatty) acid ligase